MEKPDVPLRAADVHRRFPPKEIGNRDYLMTSRIALGYFLYIVMVLEYLPVWAFMCLFVPVWIRAFNRTHQTWHAVGKSGRIMTLVHYVNLVMSPFQLGSKEIRLDHLDHHRFVGTEEDTDFWLTNQSSVAYALFLSVLQTEIAYFRHIKQRGWNAGMAWLTVRNIVQCGVIVAIGGKLAIAWFVAARIANTITWFVFDYQLHRPSFYENGKRFALPPVIRTLWGIVFSFDNRDGVEEHYLHHCFAFVPDCHLAELRQLYNETKANAEA